MGGCIIRDWEEENGEDDLQQVYSFVGRGKQSQRIGKRKNLRDLSFSFADSQGCCSLPVYNQKQRQEIKQMMDCCRVASQRTEPHQHKNLIEIIRQKDVTIAQQASTIKELQQKLRSLNEKAKMMREHQLFELFKDKYEKECELRIQFERQVFQNMNIIADKLMTIEKSIVKQLSQSREDSEIQQSIIARQIPSLSQNISEIMPLRGTQDKTVDIGQLTKHDVLEFLEDTMNKMDFVETVVQILVVKCEKYSLENKNIKTLIHAGKKDVEKDLSYCRDQLKKEIIEKNDLKKALEDMKKQKQRWNEAYMNLGKDAQKKKLLTFHKEELVEEIIKLMLCLKKTNSEKDEKENQLLRFREEERKRYQTFLNKLKAKNT